MVGGGVLSEERPLPSGSVVPSCSHSSPSATLSLGELAAVPLCRRIGLSLRPSPYFCLMALCERTISSLSTSSSNTSRRWR